MQTNKQTKKPRKKYPKNIDENQKTPRGQQAESPKL